MLLLIWIVIFQISNYELIKSSALTESCLKINDFDIQDNYTLNNGENPQILYHNNCLIISSSSPNLSYSEFNLTSKEYNSINTTIENINHSYTIFDANHQEYISSYTRLIDSNHTEICLTHVNSSKFLDISGWQSQIILPFSDLWQLNCPLMLKTNSFWGDYLLLYLNKTVSTQIVHISGYWINWSITESVPKLGKYAGTQVFGNNFNLFSESRISIYDSNENFIVDEEYLSVIDCYLPDGSRYLSQFKFYFDWGGNFYFNDINALVYENASQPSFIVIEDYQILSFKSNIDPQEEQLCIEFSHPISSCSPINLYRSELPTEWCTIISLPLDYIDLVNNELDIWCVGGNSNSNEILLISIHIIFSWESPSFNPIPLVYYLGFGFVGISMYIVFRKKNSTR